MGANDILEQLEAAREENIRLEADNRKLEAENAKLAAAAVAISDIRNLLLMFTEREFEQGRLPSFSVFDHQFEDFEFYPRLFVILDREEAAHG